jgi:hypothetical protein
LAFLQFPLPSQAFGAVHAGELSVPGYAILPQVPLVLLQVWQGPLQAVAQQCPSAQLPLRHVLPLVCAHVCPVRDLQPPLPSHADAPEHAGALSVSPEAMFRHVPAALLHVWHVPPQAPSQQCPSAQKPLAHCPPPVQV